MSRFEKIVINMEVPYNAYMGYGLLNNLGVLCKEIFPCLGTRVAIISEQSIYKLYGKAVESSLTAAGFTAISTFIRGGETSKSMSSLADLLNFMADQGLTRSDFVLTLGGGVVGDTGGLAASLYLRGIHFVQVPTTLLAAVDSSVGGKTGINLSAGKNLAGTFWQPSLVLFDPNVLNSLPPALIREGLSEVIKCAAIADASLLDNVKNRDYISLAKAAVTIKAELVSRDERDNGSRQLLNYGHTIGHALEKYSGYDISHGHAVALGMVFCAKAALSLGWSSQDCLSPIRNVLENIGFSLSAEFPVDKITEIIMSDKKRRGDTLTLVIPESLGQCVLRPLPLSCLPSFLKATGMEIGGR